MQKPKKICLKRIQKMEPILSLHRCRKTFFLFFLLLHRCRKLFFGFFYRFVGEEKLVFCFFYRFIGVGELFFGFFYRFICAGKLILVLSIPSSVKKTFPFKVVSLYSIFFSKIVYQYRFNRYVFEYRCPSLVPVNIFSFLNFCFEGVIQNFQKMMFCRF